MFVSCLLLKRQIHRGDEEPGDDRPNKDACESERLQPAKRSDERE